jgi:hypothetical protein
MATGLRSHLFFYFSEKLLAMEKIDNKLGGTCFETSNSKT